MAEERNLSLARADAAAAAASDADDTEVTKAELQRRMDEARESITHTVTEIKETVMNQYQQVRESISDTLDWREQYRRRPVPFTVGAFGVGLVLGYSVAAAVKGGDDYEDEEDYDARSSFDRIEQGFDRLQGAPPRSYAAQPITGHAATARSSAPPPPQPQSTAAAFAGAPEFSTGAEGAGDVGPDTRPGYAGADQPQSLASQAFEPERPSLLSRFRETKAYDRLQEELSTLGDRAVEELSKTAQTVVLPAILGKLKDLIGIDLGTQREVAQRSQLEQQAAKASAATATASGPGSTPPGGSGL